MLRQQLTALTYEAFSQKFQVLFNSPQTTWQVLYHSIDPQQALFIERNQALDGFVGCCSRQGSYYHFPEPMLRSLLPSRLYPQTLKRLRYFQSPLTPDTFYIEALAVSPAVRHQGLAGKLIRQAQHYAQNHGYKQLALDVASNNLPAQKLYQKYGFTYHHHRCVPYELFGFTHFDHLILPL